MDTNHAVKKIAYALRGRGKKIHFSSIVFFIMSGVQHLERSNVERPIFRNFKITNIKIAKDQLLDYFIYEFIFCYFF